MEGRKAELLQRIEGDREVLLDFFRRLHPLSEPKPTATPVRQLLISVSSWPGTAHIAA
jgi:hypothetical protein